MTASSRRTILRRRDTPVADARAERRRAHLQQKLVKEQAALKRWSSKLKRAFNTVARLQTSILRLEKSLAEGIR
jgi:hypothetical protein